MSRIPARTRTTGSAPSHSPADIRYTPGIGLARALGWFSIGLGLAEVLAPRAMADLTGVRQPKLLQAYGVREIICGLGILTSDQPAGWLAARVAGDALDLATTGAAVTKGDQDGTRAVAATVAVAGVTALDMLCASQLGMAAAMEG